MKNTKKASKTAHKNQRDSFVRSQNEHCFLKDKQKIKYHSFILLEIVPLERIQKLIHGLDKLYAKASVASESQLRYKDILSTSHLKLFERNTINLPYVVTKKLKGKILSNCVFHDLGDHIRHIHISIYKVLPSTVILQIQVHLNDKLSKKINDVIYSYHKEIRKPVETPRGKYTQIYGPPHQKENQIYQVRKDLHKEAIDFLKKYFTGYFFELSDESISVVPSIDLFSLDYPNEDGQILDWGDKNHGFFQCFSTYIGPWDSFKYKNYLFCLESKRNAKFENYLIFANRKTTSNNMYPDIDASIEETLNFCSFDLVAINRWIKVQEEMVGTLNSTVSREISQIQQNRFSKAIETRKSVLKSIFPFERFATEYVRYKMIPDKFEFKSLKDERAPDKQIDLFNGLKEGITAKITELHELINGFTRQHESIMALKNLEFSKNMQNLIIILTIALIVLTIIQIGIGAYGLKTPGLIVRFLFG
ncbi:MAG: hypothetical protein KAW41_01040 [Candidatus Diapherotrites archaeon]|nr:hypothetical protein [Candidatus Diapherotrites archaeon]